MLRCPIFALLRTLAIAQFIAAAPADAQFMNYTPLEKLNACGEDHFYSAESENAQVAVRETLKADGSRSFRTCRDQAGNIHFHLRSAPTSDGSLCQLTETEVFLRAIGLQADPIPRSSISMKGWSASPPEEWTQIGYVARSASLALLENGGCPLGSDYRYIDARNISDADLYAFLISWKEITASPDAFDAAFANVEIVVPFPRFWDSSRLQAAQADFRKAVFGEGVHLLRVECTGGKCTAALAVRGIPSMVGERGAEFRWIEFKVSEQSVVLTRSGFFVMA